jgi:hypothetical protein
LTLASCLNPTGIAGPALLCPYSVTGQSNLKRTVGSCATLLDRQADVMLQFLSGVLASLSAAVIAGIFIRYFPRRHKFLMSFVGRILGCGIECVYKNEDEATGDILKSASTSKQIRVLSIRGFRLTNEERPLNRLLGNEYSYDRLEVMIANPHSAAVTKRAQGFADLARTYAKASLYVDDIVRSLNVLLAASAKNRRIQVRMHTQCESFRLLLTDDDLYLSFFPKGKSASKSPVYRIRRGSYLYDAFVAHYDWVRDNLSDDYVGQYLSK